MANLGYILGGIALAADVIALADWLKNRTRLGWRSRIYPFVVIILSALSTYLISENFRLRSIQSEAHRLVASWPAPDRLAFESKGVRIGIYLGGLAFIEKHRKDFPETYDAAKVLRDRAQNFQAPKTDDESHKDFDRLEDIAGAMITLVKSIEYR